MAYSWMHPWIMVLLMGILGLAVGIVLKGIIIKEIHSNDHQQKEVNFIDPAVIILNALFYISVFKVYGFTAETAGYCILGSLLLLIALVDLKTMLISNWSILLILLSGVVFAFFIPEISWLERIIGFFSASTILLIIAVLSKGGLGGGDIKLMAAVGFYLGWKLTLWSLFSASIIGGIVGVAILATGKGKLKTEIPFGPFLVAGILSSILFGEQLIGWYWNLLS